MKTAADARANTQKRRPSTARVSGRAEEHPMPFSSWRRWIQSLAGDTRTRVAPRGQRLLLETLEDRCLLSVYNPQVVVPLNPGAVEGTALSNATTLGSFVSFDP